MRDPDVWCCSLFGCRDVTISNVKLVGLWRYNADGIDVCNSQNVQVRDCFVRAFDDALVIKGLKPRRRLVRRAAGEERQLPPLRRVVRLGAGDGDRRRDVCAGDCRRRLSGLRHRAHDAHRHGHPTRRPGRDPQHSLREHPRRDRRTEPAAADAGQPRGDSIRPTPKAATARRCWRSSSARTTTPRMNNAARSATWSLPTSR